MTQLSQLVERKAGKHAITCDLFQQAPREAPPRTAKVSGSGSGIAAGRFILGIMETVLW